MKKLLLLLVFVSAAIFAQDKTLFYKFENTSFPQGTVVTKHGNVSVGALTSNGSDLTSILGRQIHNAVQFPSANTDNYFKASFSLDMFTNVSSGTSTNALYPASMSIWVKRTGEIPTGATRTLAMMGNGYNDGFGIQINGNGNIAGKYRSYNLSTTALATDILPLDTWANLIFVADPTNSVFKIYVNGVLEETTSASTLPTNTRKLDVLLVGCQTNSSTSSFRFFAINLAIDEVYVINRVLISSEISDIVNTVFRSKSSGNWNDVNTWQSTYDNTTWFDATVVPTALATSVSILNGHNVTVSDNTTIAGNLAINPGGQLTLNSGATLGITGNLSINSDAANGTGTLLDANPNGGLTVSGTTNVYQYISSSQTGVNGRNWYISSPLSAASTSVITTATGNGLVYFNGSTWVDEGSTMDVMKGYIAKSPAQNTTINFTGGSLNTGDKMLENLPLGFNLIGNPYASYVDFAQATKTNIANSIWYRSKREGTYNFHTYNVTGGVSVKDGSALIPPMQSFWIKTTSATNTFGFSNVMRSHQDQTVMANRLKAPRSDSQKLLRLQVSNGVYSDETVIYFNPNAQNFVDDYDSQKMFNNSAAIPEIFTKVGHENLVINGMNEILYNTEIPLGFTTSTAGDFSILRKEFVNFDVDTRIILKDNLFPNSDFELADGVNYNFSSQPTSNSDNRFSLIFRTANTTTGAENAKKGSAQVFVNASNQIAIIAAPKSNYSIYNAMGQLIENGILKSELVIQNSKLTSGVYFVQLTVDEQKEIHKIVIR